MNRNVNVMARYATHTTLTGHDLLFLRFKLLAQWSPHTGPSLLTLMPDHPTLLLFLLLRPEVRKAESSPLKASAAHQLLCVC